MAMIVVAQGADTTRTITRECARLPGREKGLILGIVRQFRGARSREEPDLAGASSEGR